jgi:hypothetical protein
LPTSPYTQEEVVSALRLPSFVQVPEEMETIINWTTYEYMTVENTADPYRMTSKLVILRIVNNDRIDCYKFSLKSKGSDIFTKGKKYLELCCLYS